MAELEDNGMILAFISTPSKLPIYVNAGAIAAVTEQGQACTIYLIGGEKVLVDLRSEQLAERWQAALSSPLRGR